MVVTERTDEELLAEIIAEAFRDYRAAGGEGSPDFRQIARVKLANMQKREALECIG